MKLHLRRQAAFGRLQTSGRVIYKALIGRLVTGSLIALQTGRASLQTDNQKHRASPASGLDVFIYGEYRICTR